MLTEKPKYYELANERLANVMSHGHNRDIILLLPDDKENRNQAFDSCSLGTQKIRKASNIFLAGIRHSNFRKGQGKYLIWKCFEPLGHLLRLRTGITRDENNENGCVPIKFS
jgi:hypothetical protein